MPKVWPIAVPIELNKYDLIYLTWEFQLKVQFVTQELREYTIIITTVTAYWLAK